MDLYNYAWFLSFGVSFAVYAVLMKVRPAGRSEL
jgi:cytosine/uracil/thiamine/allantoin permease